MMKQDLSYVFKVAQTKKWIQKNVKKHHISHSNSYLLACSCFHVLHSNNSIRAYSILPNTTNIQEVFETQPQICIVLVSYEYSYNLPKDQRTMKQTLMFQPFAATLACILIQTRAFVLNTEVRNHETMLHTYFRK
jgi:hypothetical protein